MEKPKVITWFHGSNWFLSNFYPGDNTSVEHKFQADKTTDPEWKKKILAAKTPNKAKKLGRQAPLVDGWEPKLANTSMLQHIRDKFKDPAMAKKLLDTGEAELVEGNDWHDNRWGDCQCNVVKTPRFGIKQECKKVGENRLGKIIMQVRAEIRASLSSH